MRDDFANANYGEVKKKVKGLVDRCAKKGCSDATRAQLHVALGMVAAQVGQGEEAKSQFAQALGLDASAKPMGEEVPDGVKARFDEVQKTFLANRAIEEEGTWANKAGFELASQASMAEVKGDFAECISKDRAALQVEDHVGTRLHLASCEERGGKILDAVRDTQKALEQAIQKRNAPLAKAAQKRLQDLLPKIPHVEFVVTQKVGDLAVKFNDKPVPSERLTQQFAIDPGTHTVHAEGSVQGVLMTFDQTIEVKEAETARVEIRLKPTVLTPGQLQCMLAAKTENEIKACLPQKESRLLVRAGTQVSAYADTTAVHVIAPSVNAQVSAPTEGWNVGASYLIDVLTAASPDVVSTASRRFNDTRHAVSGGGGYKPGRFGAQARGYFSTEKDYLSRGANLALTGDFLDKQFTPTVGYGISFDTIGRAGTPYSVYSQELTTHAIDANTTIVMSPTSVLTVGGSVILERGDQSKPYRYIPMFAAGTGVPIGAGVDLVNASRLPIRPLEQLPTERERYAIAGRYAVRLGGRATLRLEERLYFDSWSTFASTSDMRYLYDLTKQLRVWPHVHFNVQSGASFFQRVYNASPQVDGTIRMPKYRSTDRELSPLFSVTLGGGARYALSPESARLRLAVSLQFDAMYSHYFNALYITGRLATYSTLGFDVEFE